jgi:hypothetical protein
MASSVADGSGRRAVRTRGIGVPGGETPRAIAKPFGGILVQFFLGGAGAFGAASWDVHAGFGYALAIASLVLLLLSLAGRWLVRRTLVLFGLVVV